MSWQRDSLWAKARLFFEYAVEHDRDDPRFGLWCALGLELLAKAAVSSVSPTLLAEPDRDHRHLLHALGRGDPKVGPQSLGGTQVFRLCETLFPDTFNAECGRAAVALLNRRNAELHSGESAFVDYTTQHWIAGFYAGCKALVAPLGETLQALLGEEEATEAEHVLATAEKAVLGRVKERIARYRTVFHDRDEAEKQGATSKAAEAAELLAHKRHHKVDCPACSSTALLQGDALGGSRVSHDEDQAEIVVRQAVAPRNFACSACGLKLDGYAELAAAGLGNQYTRTTRYTPEEYYELINPDDDEEIARIASDRLGMFFDESQEYDNE